MLNAKKLFAAAAVSTILLTSASPAFADKKEEVKPMTTLEDNVFKGYTNKLDDGSKSYYYLDVTTNEKADEDDQNAAESAIENTMDFFTGKSLEEKATNIFYEGKNMLANTVFRYNVFIVTALINGLNMVFDHNVINQLIDTKMENMIQSIVGIDESGKINDTGLFGQLMPVISSLAVMYGLYLFIGKRQQLGAFQSIGHTILVCVIAITFFSSYGWYLKGMNQISTEMSQVVLTGPSKALTKADQPMTAIRKEMFDNIWDQFVHRPYMFMQYGTDEDKDIGKKRIDTLLKKRPGEKRLEYIEKNEVKEKKNINMTYANVDNRLIFTGVYSFVNTISGVPFTLLMIILEACQFWYIGIASVAPFVFIWAAFPQQIGVLNRFAFQLSLPLIVKVAASLATLIYFTVVSSIYEVNSTSTGGYIGTVVMMMAFLLVLVFLWKPIKKIFGASKQFKFMMREVNQFKRTMAEQTAAVTKIAGATIGAAVGGPTGAAVGSNLGGQFAHGLIDQSYDEPPAHDTNSETNDKAPSADLPPLQNESHVPPVVVDWRDNNAKDNQQTETYADLPAAKTETTKENEQQEQHVVPFKDPKSPENNQNDDEQDDEYIELADLPPLKEDENKADKDAEGVKN